MTVALTACSKSCILQLNSRQQLCNTYCLLISKYVKKNAEFPYYILKYLFFFFSFCSKQVFMLWTKCFFLFWLLDPLYIPRQGNLFLRAWIHLAFQIILARLILTHIIAKLLLRNHHEWCSAVPRTSLPPSSPHFYCSTCTVCMTLQLFLHSSAPTNQLRAALYSLKPHKKSQIQAPLRADAKPRGIHRFLIYSIPPSGAWRKEIEKEGWAKGFRTVGVGLEGRRMQVERMLEQEHKGEHAGEETEDLWTSWEWFHLAY